MATSIVEPTVESVRDPNAELAAQMARLEQGIRSIDQRTSWLPNPQQQQQAPPARNFFVEPEVAAQEIANRAAAPAMQLAANNARYIARDMASRNKGVSAVFEHYGPEVDAEIGQWAPIAALDANNWTKCAIIVKDKHADDLAKLKAAPNANFLEGRSGAGGPSAEVADEPWTAQDAAVSMKMGMGRIDPAKFNEDYKKAIEWRKARGIE